jgi:putative restriction endonuclease
VSLADYQRKFRALYVNSRDGRRSPHKICMLLAMLDLARAGSLKVNRIVYGPALLERYSRYFDSVRAEQDHPNAYFPFFHLGGALRAIERGGGRPASFWHLQPLPGHEMELARMTTVRSHRDITEVIAYASLDAELFELLQVESNIEVLAKTLAQHWFDRGLEDLAAVANEGRQISLYERQLRSFEPQRLEAREPPEAIRSPAFRRVVIENYDFRCAASGERIVLPDGTPMVEAAHIHPFSESADDDPRNGMALTPDMHWAMDKYLIAPDPEFVWRVSRNLDDRIPEYQRLTNLNGKKVFLPGEKRFWPKRESLAWRIARLNAG